MYKQNWHAWANYINNHEGLKRIIIQRISEQGIDLDRLAGWLDIDTEDLKIYLYHNRKTPIISQTQVIWICACLGIRIKLKVEIDNEYRITNFIRSE
jgi:hypothetical protein